METNEELLYQKILKNSWISKVANFLEFIYEEAGILETDNHKKVLLIDTVLKRILNNLRDNVPLKKIKKIHSKEVQDIEKQCSYDLTIKIVASYYENNFIINGKVYTTLDIIFSTIQNDITSRNKTLFEITSDVLRNLFALHYVLCVKRY